MASKLAIAYQMKKKGKKCASGGTVSSGDPEMNYAKGGDVKGVHAEIAPSRRDGSGVSEAGHYARRAKRAGTFGETKDYADEAKEEHYKVLGQSKSMKGPTSGKSGFAYGGSVPHGAPVYSKEEDSKRSNMADGGETACPHCNGLGYQNGDHELDMIGSILRKRKMAFGGITEDMGEGVAADEEPNEFDYLVKNEPPSDESSAGNEHGDKFDANHHDVVSLAMAKRKKAKRD